VLRDSKNNPVIKTAETIKIRISKIGNFFILTPSLSLNCVIHIHYALYIVRSHLLKADVAGVIGAQG
jgi:hypothetical protein